MCFYGELHWQLVDDFFCVAIDDEADCFFGVDASLVAVEELVFADFACCGFVFYDCGVVVYVHVWEGVCSALASQQE